MSTESEQILAEAVRKYPALYDKQDKYFKDKNKKRLASHHLFLEDEDTVVEDIPK